MVSPTEVCSDPSSPDGKHCGLWYTDMPNVCCHCMTPNVALTKRNMAATDGKPFSHDDIVVFSEAMIHAIHTLQERVTHLGETGHAVPQKLVDQLDEYLTVGHKLNTVHMAMHDKGGRLQDVKGS